MQHADARGVAIRKTAFGEGTEHFAYQFFEVTGDGRSVVGDALVAKEPRFVVGQGELLSSNMKSSARSCRLQGQAQKLAELFNSKLDAIPKLDPQTARVEFLACSVYTLKDAKAGISHSVLVEPRLFGKFQKWNSNNGVSY